MDQDWLNALIEECKAIVTEYGFTSRFSKIEGYHTLGLRILEDNDNLERSKIYGKGVVQGLSAALGMSPRTIHYAINFAQKFPDLSLLPEGKDISWTKIIQKYLPDNPQPETKKVKVCPYCGHELDHVETRG